jgi:tRNA G18 (ribose-2'-O)-methylase SpoU
MELYEILRNQQDNLINDNAASIVISRITRSDDGAGGFKETPSTLAAQNIRIYNKNTRVLSIVDGGWHSQRVTKAVAKYDANIKKESATYLDTFSYGGIAYKVQDVKPIYNQGYVVFLELELVEVT